MKKIILLTFILSTLSIKASIWERVDGPYDYQFIENIFKFNQDLCISNSIDINYLSNDEKWIKVEKGILSDFGNVYSYSQNKNVAIISNTKRSFITYNSWDTWEEVFGLHPFSIVIIDSTIFAQQDYSNGKLFKLTANSKNWESVSFLNDNKLDTVIGDKIYSEGNIIIAGDKDYPDRAGTNGGIYISKDKGVTWSKSNNLDVKVNSLILHNGIIFVGGLDQNLYKSTDYGETWDVDKKIAFPVDLFFSQGNNLYAGIDYVGLQSGREVGVHLSTDNGKTWVKRHNGIWGTNIKKFVYLNSILYCQDDRKHIFKTTDNGLNWSICPILTDSLTSYGFLNIKDTLIVATSGRRGLYYSTEAGTNWKIYGNGFSTVATTIYNWNNIFVTKVAGDMTLNISKDNGQNWKNVDVGIFSTDNFIQDIELIGGDTLLLATTHGTRFSTDFGDSWHKFHTATLDSSFDTRNIVRIDDNKLLITAYNEGLFKSNDNGQSWKKVNTEFTDLTNIIYATLEYVGGKLFTYIHDKGLYYSDDEGVNWRIFSENIEKDDYFKDVISYEGNFIIKSPKGIFISNVNGKNLTFLEIEEFKNENTYVKDITTYDSYLFAACNNGIWRAKLSDLGIVKSSVESETERNYLYTYPPYPLPAKSEVKVLFYWDINIPMTVDDISIYDLSGQKIEAKNNLKLIKQESHYGNIIWDCSTTPAGIYLINIKHGTESKSVKVVVE